MLKTANPDIRNNVVAGWNTVFLNEFYINFVASGLEKCELKESVEEIFLP